MPLYEPSMNILRLREGKDIKSIKGSDDKTTKKTNKTSLGYRKLSKATTKFARWLTK